VLGVPWPEGTDYAHLIIYYWHPRIFRPSDGPAEYICWLNETKVSRLLIPLQNLEQQTMQSVTTDPITYQILNWFDNNCIRISIQIFIINVEQLYVEPSPYDKILRAEYALQNTDMPNIRIKYKLIDFTVKSFFKSKTWFIPVKSLSEALILAYINPLYDNRLFIELQEKYKLTTCCVHKLYFFVLFLTFVHNLCWTCIAIQSTICCHIMG
jgi:hypothetical protein